MLQLAGVGVDKNATFELVLATAVGLGLAQGNISSLPLARRLGSRHAVRWLAAFLIMPLLLDPRSTPYSILSQRNSRAEIADRIAVLQAEVARVRVLPGLVSCSVMTVCYLAGKPFVFDDFAVRQRLATRHISTAEYQASILGIHFEPVDLRTRWRVPRSGGAGRKVHQSGTRRLNWAANQG
jgi:hypothetical protein